MAVDRKLAARTFSEVLHVRAEGRPDDLAFRWLDDGGVEGESFSFSELHGRALALAALLRERLPAGARVLLLLPPGLDYVVSVYACFHAGAIGVCAAPPQPKRLHRTLPRLLAIAADADAHAVIAPAAMRDAAQGFLEGDQALAQAVWIAPEDAGATPPGDAAPYVGRPDEVAFLQYTSGSTGDPRGVMLTHGNLVEHSEAIARAFGNSDDVRGYSWLPPYHDMGLIGCILQPVYAGFEGYLTSPISVIKRPALWLEAITRYRITHSGGPNFGYDLCVRRIAPEAREALDLSSWEVAFNGAEPILARTLDDFSSAFGPCGFRRSAFFPCYGLAEATLMVTAAPREDEPTIVPLSAAGLRAGRAEAPTGAADAVELVGCGRPGPDHELAIVDPATRAPARENEIGEIWFAGPSVAAGYWKQPDQTAELFGAELAGRPGTRFLRTGDLGLVRGDELLVAGRIKDLLIVAGRNHHPHDIEASAEAAHPLLRPHCSAAFAVDGGGEAAIALEIAPGDATLDDVMAAVRRRVADEHELQLKWIALCEPSSVPKTTSGKVQRRLCGQLVADGEIEPLAQWRADEAA